MTHTDLADLLDRAKDCIVQHQKSGVWPEHRFLPEELGTAIKSLRANLPDAAARTIMRPEDIATAQARSRVPDDSPFQFPRTRCEQEVDALRHHADFQQEYLIKLQGHVIKANERLDKLEQDMEKK